MKKIVLLCLILFVTVFTSGCVKQEGATTTTSTTTTTTIQVAGNILANWTKESGVRIDGGISSSTIMKDNEYWMYYTGNGIELAISSDGLNFGKKGNVVGNGLSGSEQEMVTNPAVFQLSDGTYRMI